MKSNAAVRIPLMETSASRCNNCGQSRFCLPNELNPNQTNIFEHLTSSEKISKGGYLYTPESTAIALYIIKSGSVKTLLSNQAGNEQVLGFHCPGDSIGFDSFYSGKHTCTAQALDDTFVCKLSLQHLDVLYEKIPSIRHKIMQQVGTAVHHNHLMMFSLGKMQSEERLANFLINTTRRNTHRNISATKLNLCMTRSDLANYLGMAVETLSRLFSQFQTKKIIKVKLRSVEITDHDALRNLTHSLRF